MKSKIVLNQKCFSCGKGIFLGESAMYQNRVYHVICLIYDAYLDGFENGTIQTLTQITKNKRIENLKKRNKKNG